MSAEPTEIAAKNNTRGSLKKLQKNEKNLTGKGDLSYIIKNTKKAITSAGIMKNRFLGEKEAQLWWWTNILGSACATPHD